MGLRPSWPYHLTCSLGSRACPSRESITPLVAWSLRHLDPQSKPSQASPSVLDLRCCTMLVSRIASAPGATASWRGRETPCPHPMQSTSGWSARLKRPCFRYSGRVQQPLAKPCEHAARTLTVVPIEHSLVPIVPSSYHPIFAFARCSAHAPPLAPARARCSPSLQLACSSRVVARVAGAAYDRGSCLSCDFVI